jgi:uncharacterized protein YndB with AHSA1/START domain
MTQQSLKSARAIADLTSGTILAVVEIAATPERVFRALTTDEVASWWGSPELYQVTDWSADLRVGGAWRSGGRGKDGHSFQVTGEYLEIDPPKKLVHTWKAEWDGGETTIVRYQLDAIPGGTRVTLRHDGFGERAQSCQGHADGWERVLGWLTKHFPPMEEIPAPTYYLCRLIPPRPSFTKDMTAEERAVMMSHAKYWRELLGRGAAIVFGPVADPSGPWGMGVAAAASEAELREMLAGDPAIKSERGFRYESMPMLSAVHR